MEPITHLMTGACLARAGFNRKVAYATVTMTLAAEMPDIDTVWSVGGPVAAFQHHRGWTHTFLGLPIEAAALVSLVWLFHRWSTVRDPNTHKQQVSMSPPVRWGLLFWFALVALLSHLLLDWTNNYGLRPFFPFNPRWYSGSIVFIFEPVIFLMLLAALVAPALFGLIGTEVGVRRDPFHGRGWAIAALLGIIIVWGWRGFEKAKALELLSGTDFSQTGSRDSMAVRTSASPHPITPFRWHVVAEMPEYYQLAMVDTLNGTVIANISDRFYKPPSTIATSIAKRSWLGEAYLDWSAFPLVSETATAKDSREPSSGSSSLVTVTFRDLRFMYDVPFMDGRKKPPLTGMVSINEDRTVVQMEMNGHVQR